MTELERFLAVVRFERPDYWPLITAGGLGYVHRGGLEKLHREGLPQHVNDLEAWLAYWGQCGFEPLTSLARDAPGIQSETWTEGDFEFIRYETGALTRQVTQNDQTYSMPDFMEFHVRDRASWERFRDLSTPTHRADIEEEAERLDGRERLERLIGALGGRLQLLVQLGNLRCEDADMGRQAAATACLRLSRRRASSCVSASRPGSAVGVSFALSARRRSPP